MEQTGIRYQIFTLLSGLSGVQAYAVIFGVLFVCGLGVPVPEDITLLAAGFLSSNENISLAGALFIGFVGVLIGDTLLYVLGRRFGRHVFKWPGLHRIFTPERIETAERRIHENGRTICFSARFLPGLRSPIFLTVGVMRVPFAKFILLDGLAALISVPVWVILGHFFGTNLDEGFRIAKKLNGVLIIVAMLLVSIILARVFRAHHKETKSKLAAPSGSLATAPADSKKTVPH